MSTLSLWLLFVYYQRRTAATGRSTRWAYWGSVAAFAVSLLSKEISLAYLFINGLLILYQHRDFFRSDTLDRPQQLLCAVKEYLPFVVLAGVFYLIHSSVGVQQVVFGDPNSADRYTFRIGPQILSNIGMLLFASFQPTSSVDLYLAVYARDFVRVAGHAIIMLIFLATIAWGIWRARRVRLAMIFLAGMVISYFPVFFLGQVSELYTSNGMPMAAGLVGLGLGTVIERSREVPWRRYLAVAGTVALLIVCALATLDKINRLQATGAKIPPLMEALAPYIESTPHNQYLLLLDDQPDPSYSVFENGGLDLITRVNLNERLGHPMAYGTNREEQRRAHLQGGCTVLSLKESTVELIYQNDTVCSPDL